MSVSSGGRNRTMELALKKAAMEKSSPQKPQKKATAAVTKQQPKVTAKGPSTKVVRKNAKAPPQPAPKRGSQSRPENAPTKPTTKKLGFITITDLTEVNPKLLASGAHKKVSRSNSVAFGEQCNSRPKGYAELVLGLDFGTASTKVVIMESGSERAWAIAYTNDDTNPYLLPSEVFLRDGTYSLRSGQKISDLKLPLLAKSPQSKEHQVHVVAFLALVIRYARGWFFENYADVFPGAEFEWHYHIGLPASNFRDEALVNCFRKLLAAAVGVSLSPSTEVTSIVVARQYVKAERAFEGKAGDDELMEARGNTEVFPEIAAQLHGYVMSDRWDAGRPQFMLVDVGGGTVDASILNVNENIAGELRYTFLKSSVQPRGVVMLHRNRVDWIHKSIEQSECRATKVRRGLESMSFAKDNTLPLPGSITEYLVGAKYPPKDQCSDQEFYNRYGDDLWSDVIVPVKGMIDTRYKQWRSLPFLLCGGGSSHSLYKRFKDVMEAQKDQNKVRLEPIRLEKPSNLVCPACAPREYHRLSVAYGLAHYELGEIISESNIDAIGVAVATDWRDSRFVSKDWV